MGGNVKKLLVLYILILLAVPALGYAGSATSRWDLTIGGRVQLDVAWASQSVNQDVTYAERSSGITTSSRDKYNALSWGSGQTRINFLVNGPVTWGAKTSAFVEFDFRNMSTNAVAADARNSTEDYGLAALRHAFMKFDWPTFSLLIGQTWNPVGYLPSYITLNTNDLKPFNKFDRQPQITAVWQATKTFSVTFGAMSPYNVYKWPGGTLSNGIITDEGFTRSQWPQLFTEFVYKTDACGKIGPWMLQFGLGGAYSQEKPIAPANFGPVGNVNNQNAANTVSNTNISGVQYWNATGYDSSNVDMWIVTAKTFIPIIPEKAPGKRAGSLGLAMTGFTGQDIRLFLDSTAAISGVYSYNRDDPTASGNVATANYVAPVASGGWGQLMFYFTDTVWANFEYGQLQANLSQWRRNQIGTGAVDRVQHYVLNLIYDPNPAIRLALEYAYYTTHWARDTSAFNPANPSSSTANGLKSNGSLSTVRFGAQYFF